MTFIILFAHSFQIKMDKGGTIPLVANPFFFLFIPHLIVTDGLHFPLPWTLLDPSYTLVCVLS